MFALVAVALVAVALPARAALPPQPSRTVFFGIDVPDDTPALVDRAAGRARARPPVANIFVQLDSCLTPATRQGLAARRLDPMVSLEPWSWRSRWGQADLPQYGLGRVAGGSWDPQLTSIAQAIAAYQAPVILRFAHEMNGWWYPWAVGQNGNTAADYVAAWRHVWTLFQSAGATNARFLWSPNALTGSGQETPLEQAYPGDAYVSMIGMTAYGRGGTPSTTYDPTYARLVALAPGKPVVLAETGVDGPTKTAWLYAFGDWLVKHTAVTGFVWFNTTPETTGSSGDYRFDDTTAHAAAFRQTLTRFPRTPR